MIYNKFLNCSSYSRISLHLYSHFPVLVQNNFWSCYFSYTHPYSLKVEANIRFIHKKYLLEWTHLSIMYKIIHISLYYKLFLFFFYNTVRAESHIDFFLWNVCRQIILLWILCKYNRWGITKYLLLRRELGPILLRTTVLEVKC